MSECKRCGGRGWVVKADGGAGAARRCECRSVPLSLADRLTQAGVWEVYRGCTRGSWIEEPDLWPAKLQDFGTQSFLVTICGGPGSGKTHLATAILAEHLEAGKQGIWREISSTLHAIKEAMGEGRSTRLWDELRDGRLLVLDAYGSHQATPWADATISQVLRYRHGRLFPTVLTINLPSLLDLDEVEPGLGSRCGGSIVILLKGPDRRIARVAG